MTTGPAPRGRPAFWVLAILLGALAVETGCRVIEWVENRAARRRNPYVEAVNPVPAFEVVELGGQRWVKRTGFHPLMATNQPMFPLERPAGGLRVFVLGGSAAAGWPFQLDDTNLTALLERKLRALYPGRPIEVFNMAAGTYASHRVKLILEEVLRYRPDAVFLYNGNNEFLENLVFRPQRPPAPLDRSATARLAWRVGLALGPPPPRFDVQHYDFDDQQANHLSFAFSRASRYREDPRQFQALLDHYRFNVRSMIASAGEAGVPLFVLTCPVNLKDWTPNVSRHRRDLSPAERERWTTLFREGVLALERGDPAAAVAPLRQAAALDDEHAEGHFRLGAALRLTGALAEAKAEYVRALERDAFPFRELPELQAVLREEVARARAPLVDIIPPLEATVPDGILGLDAFVDYVHLTERSQEVVAQEMLEALAARGLLAGVTPAAVAGARIEVVHRFHPERDLYAADVGFNLAMLMHQHDRLDALFEEAARTFERAAREAPELAAHCRERLEIDRQIYQAAADYGRLRRAERLGLLRETYTPEQAQAIFARYSEMIHWSNADRLTREEFAREAVRPGAE